MVNKTYPPEINGVAATIARVAEGLHEREHRLQLLRPRQSRDEAPAREARFTEALMREPDYCALPAAEDRPAV